MKYYKVTGKQVTFNSGMVLKLDDSQSIIRFHALAKTGAGNDIFVVKSPVQFKQGERIGVVKGHLSRALESQLTLLDENKKETPTIKQSTEVKDKK